MPRKTSASSGNISWADNLGQATATDIGNETAVRAPRAPGQNPEAAAGARMCHQ